MPASSARSAALSGSTCGLCDATSTLTRRVKTLCVASASVTRTTAAVSPAITVDAGPLLAATTTPGSSAIAFRASSAESSTVAMLPCPRTDFMRRLRTQMIAAASSRVSAPATWAAAISPMLWPTTASGSTPQERHSRARATSIAKSVGCSTSISPRREVLSSRPSASSTEKPAVAAIAASHSSIATRKLLCDVSSSRPMPSH